MAHECPECFQMCYCDVDDTFMEAPTDCRCDCLDDDPDEWDDDDYPDDEWFGDEW